MRQLLSWKNIRKIYGGKRWIMVHNKIKAGLHDGIPIAAGYFSVSFTFGMMAVQDGISPFHAVLISLLNLTSAGQFAGLTVIVSGASLFEMALTQLVINIRYALMSVSLSQKRKWTGRRPVHLCGKAAGGRFAQAVGEIASVEATVFAQSRRR